MYIETAERLREIAEVARENFTLRVVCPPGLQSAKRRLLFIFIFRVFGNTSFDDHVRNLFP